MNRDKRVKCLLLLTGILSACYGQQKSIVPETALERRSADLKSVKDQMEQHFRWPGDDIQTSIYWYWMSDNISAEGVVKDLNAMKKAGINRAFIGNIGYPSTPYGKVKILSDEWWSILDTALHTAANLNIEIGIFNSPGWSQSGGPWVKPEQSMRYLTMSEQRVKGGKKIQVKLDKPQPSFQDIKVIAFRAPAGYHTYLSSLQPVVKTNVAVTNAVQLSDGNRNVAVDLPSGQTIQIDLSVKNNFSARSLVLYPAKRTLKANAELQVFDGTIYTTVKRFTIDRSNSNLNVGFDPYAPVAISFPELSSKNFRLVITDATEGFGLSEIEISAAPVIEDFAGKTLAKMFQTPLPYWKEYQWAPQAEINSAAALIDPETVKDVSAGMKSDGSFSWTFPKGDWIIMRTGMAPTLVTNGPASPQGTGLEVDKMSKEHVASHFDSFLGEIIRRIPEAHRRSWKVAVQDSYETGGQNWTDTMMEKFIQTYGYNPLPYLPVMKGMVVGSQEKSDRFLWDLRRLIADRVAYDYVGGLKAISNKHGLTTWLENYGHWGFPGEFLQYGGQSDEIGGEFWSEGELGNIENRAASSAAHIYGKNKVSAESFTAGGKAYARYPALMKQRGDRFFTEGINNTLMHVYIQQPDERMPGINADFGNEFNRHNTWFSYLNLFTAYLKRCNFMLQQGTYVADAAYFIGEDAPKMTGITDPALPEGYSFDYINAEVLLNRIKVKDGKMVLPDGMNYRLLVLPALETMRPELLARIKDLVEQGAHILGPAPLRSPSLKGYPASDKEVKRLAALLWGNVPAGSKSVRRFGKGTVMQGLDMKTAMDALQLIPDFNTPSGSPLLFIHRTVGSQELYFVSNQSEKEIEITPAFRVKGMQPSLWDPVTGLIRKLPEYKENEGAIEVPLKLAPLQSFFVLFDAEGSVPVNSVKTAVSKNFPAVKLIQELTGSWQLDFEDKLRGPQKPVLFKQLEDWSTRNEKEIRYYSGTVHYAKTFNYKPDFKTTQVMLSLGNLKAMARVKVNGQEIGGLWTAPWELDITSALVQGENKLEINVVNTWVNRLIGDSFLKPEERTTWTSVNPFKPENKLEASGLTGPVRLYGVPAVTLSNQ